MRHGSLFSGIGGAELAASWMGWENVFHCEINKYNLKLLKQHFPESISYEDIKTTEFIQHRGRINILTGGFPCQPFSTAGKRKGTADDRHLWPEMLRAIREIQPRWIVGENVRGLTNWNGGMVFDQVQADMEAEGYEIIPFLFPACAVNAPHRRDRIWFIAHATGCNDRGIERKISGKNGGSELNNIPTSKESSDRFCKQEITADTIIKQCRQKVRSGQTKAEYAGTGRLVSTNWRDFPTESPLCGRDDVVPNRVDRIEGLGNAWVPKAALQIFKAIEQYETLPYSKGGTDRCLNK